MIQGLNKLRGIGDVVALVAKPVARGVDAATKHLPQRFQTDLKNCGGCGQRQETLNKAIPFKQTT